MSRLPSSCDHLPNTACDLCCMACAFSAHICVKCGSYTNHEETDCVKGCHMSELEWRAKGAIKDLTQCKHEKDDGCKWCCISCYLEHHKCSICGMVSDHNSNTCIC